MAARPARAALMRLLKNCPRSARSAAAMAPAAASICAASTSQSWAWPSAPRPSSACSGRAPA
eukprot:12010199-Alexandrium_andersonii.AAC.1